MAIKSSKQKGSAGEREVIHLLTKWAADVGVDLDLERNLEQTRYGGSDVNGVPGLEIEVKRAEANGINQWWDQVCRAAKKSNKRPFLIHRKNRQPWRVRVYSQVAFHEGNNWSLIWVVTDLEIKQAEAWFKEYVKVVFAK